MSDFKNFIKQFGVEALGRYYGVYTAIVARDQDPEGMARVLVSVPEVFPKDQVRWARPLNMVGGQGHGAQVLPAVNDWINVMFLNGDPQFPLWIHGGYAKGQKPPEFESNLVSGFKTLGGTLIQVDDETNTVTVKTPNGKPFTISDDGVKLGEDYLTNSKELIDKLKELADMFSPDGGNWIPGLVGGLELNPATVVPAIENFKWDLDKIESKSS